MQPSGQRRDAEICQRESGKAMARKNGGFIQVEASAGAAQNDYHRMRSATWRNENSSDGCFASGSATACARVCTLGFVWDLQIARHSSRREKISRQGGASKYAAFLYSFEIHAVR